MPSHARGCTEADPGASRSPSSTSGAGFPCHAAGSDPFLHMAGTEHLSGLLAWAILPRHLQGTPCFHRLVVAGRWIFGSRCCCWQGRPVARVCPRHRSRCRTSGRAGRAVCDAPAEDAEDGEGAEDPKTRQPEPKAVPASPKAAPASPRTARRGPSGQRRARACGNQGARALAAGHRAGPEKREPGSGGAGGRRAGAGGGAAAAEPEPARRRATDREHAAGSHRGEQPGRHRA